MAITKAQVKVALPGNTTVLATGMMYLHTATDRSSGIPKAQGTISPVEWAADEYKHARYEPGQPFSLTLDDDRTLSIVLTKRIFTDCGPEVLRFVVTRSLPLAEQPAETVA